MIRHRDATAAERIRAVVEPYTGATTGYDALLDRIGAARFVLIGEASHGTREFYEERALITRRLIVEKGFAAVAVEADWPDAYRANVYARGAGTARTAEEALRGFQRFPTWMWRNTVVVDFIEWLREHNRGAPAPTGFYGLDLYSLYRSIEGVLEYLGRVDPEAAAEAKARYACFEQFHEDCQAYGYAAHRGLSESCEDGAVRQLLELREKSAEYARRDGRVAEDDLFHAVQNARLVKNAEEYYRTMFGGRVSSWNLRDRHMADTLDQLAEHLQGGRVVVWEHNSHVGDARATELGRRGEHTVGQLARERHAGETHVIGFTTYRGEVTAATDWGNAPERKRVRPGRADSYEGLFHEVAIPAFGLDLQTHGRLVARDRLERAIGVIYRPETERQSHYFKVDLARQFDDVIHIDVTTALQPLERTPLWDTGEPPETYPFGE